LKTPKLGQITLPLTYNAVAPYLVQVLRVLIAYPPPSWMIHHYQNVTMQVTAQNNIDIEIVSQTSFGHISINSLTILTVLMALESPQEDLSIDTSHVSRQSILAKILGRSTDNYYSTVY